MEDKIGNYLDKGEICPRRLEIGRMVDQVRPNHQDHLEFHGDHRVEEDRQDRLGDRPEEARGHQSEESREIKKRYIVCEKRCRS